MEIAFIHCFQTCWKKILVLIIADFYNQTFLYHNIKTFGRNIVVQYNIIQVGLQKIKIKIVFLSVLRFPFVAFKEFITTLWTSIMSNNINNLV
jgi:hypothetical protein